MENLFLKIISELCEKHNITDLNFHYFLITLSLQERIKANKREEQQIEVALEVRNKYKLPFWDSLLLTYFDNSEASETILHEVLNHNRRDDFTKIDLTDFRKLEKF